MPRKDNKMQNFDKQPRMGHESGVERVLHAVGHVVAEGAHVVADTASIFLAPYSHAAEASVDLAQPARREGDKVNPMTVDLSSFVNTEHRT